MTHALFPALEQVSAQISSDYSVISPERKATIKKLTDFIQQKVDEGKAVKLNFICTHNARRSHMAQVWAQAAAYYYLVPNVKCMSGGTEVTQFHPNAVAALKKAGFKVVMTRPGVNPVYEVSYAPEEPPLTAFSKVFDDPFNGSDDFGAVMVCSSAESNCPYVPGATRISLTFEDPKSYDGTPQEGEGYYQRFLEIGRDIFYAFSQVTLK